MLFYKRKRHFYPMRKRIARGWETFLKCLALFLVPTAVSTLVSFGWYYWLFIPDRNFGDGMQELIATAVLPTLGIIYGIMVAAIAVQTVWGEYKNMRLAVKRYDLDTFMDLRDEELSPLIHVIVGIVSFGMLAGFLVLKYPAAVKGATVIFGITFLLVLMYVVAREIDDPCAGLWYIKGIHEEWLAIDPKEYRARRCEKLRQEFLARTKAEAEAEAASKTAPEPKPEHAPVLASPAC